MRVKRLASVFMLAVLLFSLVPRTSLAASSSEGIPPFWDVIGTQYQQPVYYLHKLGVVGGVSERSYAPNQEVTRAQMAAFVVRALGMESGATGLKGQSSFNDVPGNHWASGYITLAAQLGVVNGVGNGAFNPEGSVTMEQVVAMLVRATGNNSQVQGAYPVGHLLLAKSQGMLDGINFVMGASAKRGDVAIMLSHAIFDIENAGTKQTLSQSVFKVVDALVIEPEGGILLPGGRVSAMGVDWTGRRFPVKAAWSVLQGTGRVDNDGYVSGMGSDGLVVKASYQGLVSTKTFVTATRLEVEPAVVTVNAGGSAQLNAYAVTSQGTRTPVDAEWRVTSGAGTVDKTGKVTLSASQPVRVEARLGTMAATGEVVPVARLEITPANTAATIGQKVQLTARTLGADGNEVRGATVSWRVTSGSGTVNDQGLLTVGNSDSISVEAKVGSVSAVSTVQVISSLEISPSAIALDNGQMQTFTLRAKSASGTVIGVTPQWSIDPGLGILDSTGRFIATGSGSGFVTAKVGAMEAKATLSVSGVPARLEISADPTYVYSNGSSPVTITARVIDAQGNPKRTFDRLMFSLSSAEFGTLNAFEAPVVDGTAKVIFTPTRQSGTVQITVSAPGTNLPSANTTVTTLAPTAARIKLEAYPNPLANDGLSESTVTVTLVDASGVPIINTSGNNINVTLGMTGTGAGTLLQNGVTIPAGLKSGQVKFRAGLQLGSTTITGYSVYPVDSVTVNTVVVGNAAQLAIRQPVEETAADGVSEMLVRVEVRDTNGNTRTSDNSTAVTLAATIGTATLYNGTAIASNGVATFRLRSTTAGTVRLQASALSTGAGIRGTDGSAVFKAGPASKIRLAVEPVAFIAADARSTVRLVARILDASGNLVENANTLVTFNKIGGPGVSSLPANTTVQAQGGIAKIVVTSTGMRGTDSYSASATGLTLESSVDIRAEIGGPADHLRVAAPSVTTTLAGNTVTVSVYVYDVLNQVVTSDNGRAISLRANNPGVRITGSGVTESGVATFQVTTDIAQNVMLTAWADGLTPDLSGQTIAFTTGTADHIVLRASPEALSADGVSQAVLTPVLVDRNGNEIRMNYSVTLAVSDPSIVTLSTVTAYTAGGIVNVRSTTRPGTVTITGSGSYPVTPLTLTTAYFGVPAKVIVESVANVQAGIGQMQVKVRIVDANGNVLTNQSTGSLLSPLNLVVTGATGTTTITNTVDTYTLARYNMTGNNTTLGSANVSSGTATFTFTNTRAERVTFTPVVYYNGQQLARESNTGATVAGPASQLVMGPGNLVLSATSPTAFALTAMLADAYGNQVMDGSEAITLTPSSTLYLQLDATTVTTTNGYARVTGTTKVNAVGGATSINARTASSGLTGNLQVITDRMPDQPMVLAYDNWGGNNEVSIYEQGAKITVSVSARNAAQIVQVTINGINVTLYESVDSNVVVNRINAGGSVLTGYIKRTDLGAAGVKDIRAYVTTPMGQSAPSAPVSLIVR